MVLKKIFGIRNNEENIDIDKYMNELRVGDKTTAGANITYVKPVDMDSEGNSIDTILKEMEDRNIVILNIRNILNDNFLLRKTMRRLYEICTGSNGDIARISDDKILIVPEGIKIAYRA